MRKAGFDTNKAISLYKEGLSYKEIGLALNSKPDAIRMALKKYVPELMKNPLDKQEVIKLFKSGFSYLEISKKFNSTPEAVKKVVQRYAPEELRKKRTERVAKKVDRRLFEPQEEELNLEVVGALSVPDRKQILDEKSWGINQNESISDYSFFQWNRQSFISDKKNNRKYKFDVSRGGNIQKDLRILSL